MKITIALEQDLTFPLIDGQRKQAWFLAKFLKKKDFNVEIININSNKKEYIKEGIPLKNKSLFNFFFCKTDILHYIGSPSPIVYLLLLFSKFNSFYLTITDGELNRFWKSWFSKRSIKIINKYVKKIFLQTKYQKKIVLKYFKESKIKIIPPLIEDFNRIVKKSKKPRLLFMSHLTEHKGILLILESYESLMKKYPQLELVVADSNLKKANDKIINKINKINKEGGNIHLKGKINPERELSKAWIYLYPIKNPCNTFSAPLSLYEAYNCECYFISSNIGGIKEYFNKKYLINSFNKIELSNKIETLLKKKRINFQNVVKKIDNYKVIKKIIKEYGF